METVTTRSLRQHIVHLVNVNGKIVKTVHIEAISINDALYQILQQYQGTVDFYSAEWGGYNE